MIVRAVCLLPLETFVCHCRHPRLGFLVERQVNSLETVSVRFFQMLESSRSTLFRVHESKDTKNVVLPYVFVDQCRVVLDY